MSAQLREAASELAAVLWREHTVYRERSGGVVIRGEHVRRWISLAPAGGRNEILLRAGRILDGGTTAPARSEAVMPLTAGTAELAAACRRLLAETAAEAAVASSPGGDGPAGRRRGAGRAGRGTAPRPRRQRPPRGTGKKGRHTGAGSWIVLLCLAGVAAYYAWSAGLTP
ncbi:hypothetical protein [Streptomyces ficellus]|uniref:Uncharacterized protein n=1 Tax=Streptomyces ficellus TaxID=1977088 RepID=A0A6I6EZ08_9ACTN|nr:hypothetical protein [Streptomyces ficellus]QGV76943.1 hypothetical protein EIZ62_00700 [Streptomyces ficellus]